jgi:phage-related protein
MLVTLANGIVEQLPTLIPAIIEVVLQVVQTLIDNLPMLIEGAIQLFLGIVTGLIQALPQIIAALPTLIDSIINALIDSIPLLIECGVELFLALIENLPEIIVAIVKAAPQIVQALVRGFLELGVRLKETGSKLMKKLKEGLTSMLSNLVSAAKDLGKNIVDGIWNGISAGWDWLKEKVGGLATGLFDAAKSALGISSPSKKFRYLGEMCVAGFDDGIEDLMDGGSLGAAINNTLGTVAANVGIGEGTLGPSQTFNFDDTQTSPDAIRRKVANTMTFGLAGGI